MHPLVSDTHPTEDSFVRDHAVKTDITSSVHVLSSGQERSHVELENWFNVFLECVENKDGLFKGTRSVFLSSCSSECPAVFSSLQS